MSTQIRVLKTDGDHAAAVARLSELMDKDPAAGSADEAELELLALLIQSYEQTKFPRRHLTRSKPSCSGWISSGWRTRISCLTSVRCRRSPRS